MTAEHPMIQMALNSCVYFVTHVQWHHIPCPAQPIAVVNKAEGTITIHACLHLASRLHPDRLHTVP